MKHEIRVGLTVIGAVLLFYGIIAWANRMHFFSPEEAYYELVFDDVSGLLEGDPVIMRGYRAGRVMKISAQAQAVWVRITLDRETQLYDDVYGEIQVKELMGGKQLALFPGRSTVPFDASRPIAGRTSLDFSSAFSRMGRVMDELNPENIQALVQVLDTFSRSFSDISRQVDTRMLLELPGQLSRTLSQAEALLASARQSDVIGQTSRTLAQSDSLLRAADRTLRRFESMAEKADATTLPRIDSLMGQTLQLLARSESMLQTVEDLFRDLQNEESFAGKLLRDPAFARSVDSTLKHIDDVMLQIKEERIYVAIKMGKRKK